MSKTKEPQTVITGITVGLDGRVFVREVVIGPHSEKSML